MVVAILGSEELDIKPNDLFRMVKGWVKPHRIERIVTLDATGVCATASGIAEEEGIPVSVAEDYRQAVRWSDFVAVFRKEREYPKEVKECVRRNRLFREYVFV